MNKNLADKAIDIKGKRYVQVSDRIIFFNESYPNGSITTEIVSDLEADRVVVKATVTPDIENPTRIFSDFSQAVIGEGYINKTSALENASTSAVGRALAYMGIGVLESVASVDEIHKAENSPQELPASIDFRDLHALVGKATNITDVNNIMKNPKYATLHLEEKRKLSNRITKRIQEISYAQNISNSSNSSEN